MKRIHIVVFIATCLIFSFFLFGCGGSGPGTPGSCGQEDTGVYIRVPNMVHSSPAVTEQELWLIDLYQDMCDEDVEPWGDDYANILFESFPIYDPDIENMLFITNYRVTFQPLSPEYPPIDELRAGIQGLSFRPEQATAYLFLIFDFGRKLALQELISRGVYAPTFPFLYNMTIEIWGQDMYGQDFCVGPILRVIEVATYDYC